MLFLRLPLLSVCAAGDGLVIFHLVWLAEEALDFLEQVPRLLCRDVVGSHVLVICLAWEVLCVPCHCSILEEGQLRDVWSG